MSPSIKSRRPRLVVSLLIATSVCEAAAANSAVGQSYVQPPCQASAEPKFENELQSHWYRRFWTGECRDLPVFRCFAGRPYWNEVVHTLVNRAPADKRAEVAERACRLGSRIGLEWTRPKTERRIDTQMLHAFNGELERAPDVLAGLAAVEASVKAKLGS
jgi:hypothetical protein